jgi:hypothetical protein
MEHLPMIIKILLPFLAGMGLIVLTKRIAMSQAVICGVLGVSISAIYAIHEGLPAYPAISSKHKVGYALVAVPLLAAVLSSKPPRTQVLGFVSLLAVCFFWLVQKRLMSGNPQLHWLLPLATIFVFYFVNTSWKPKSSSPFAWPVALLSISIVACLSALLGGFLGLGQVFVSVSAFLGGLVLATFLCALAGDTSDLHLSAAPFLTLQSSIVLLLVQLSSFATNLSVLAYLLLLTLFGLPIIAHRVSNLSLTLQPFALAALSLITGGPAILFAINNF